MKPFSESSEFNKQYWHPCNKIWIWIMMFSFAIILQGNFEPNEALNSVIIHLINSLINWYETCQDLSHFWQRKPYVQQLVWNHRWCLPSQVAISVLHKCIRHTHEVSSWRMSQQFLQPQLLGHHVIPPVLSYQLMSVIAMPHTHQAAINIQALLYIYLLEH